MLIIKKVTVKLMALFAVIFLWPQVSQAQVNVTNFGTENLNNLLIYSTKNVYETVTGIVNIILSFLGALAILIILYGGFIWLTSRGNKDKIDQAKKTIISAVIGLAIIFSSYALVNWIFDKQIAAIFGVDESIPPGGYGPGSGLGGGVLESHYPARDAIGVPRNTNIYVTFREPMDINFTSNPCADLPDGRRRCNIDNDNVRLHKVSDNIDLEDDQMWVTYDPNNPKIFEFNPFGDGTNPTDYLGSDRDITRYEMVLSGWQRANGIPAFSLGYYAWQFTVGTEIDNTPPRVTLIIPEGSTAVPRNTVVQINFSESVNPILASGISTGSGGFSNIYIDRSGDPTHMAGQYLISNQYRTVEFTTGTACVQNSCGQDVYCLPAGNFSGRVTDNITDMAGNRLDGDNDNVAGGNRDWIFVVNDTLDLAPPVMTAMDSSNSFSLVNNVTATFDKPLFAGSVNSDSVRFYRNLIGDINYSPYAVGNIINIRHDKLETNTSYNINVLSGVKDSHQNCWYPCACVGTGCAACTTGGGAIPGGWQVPAP
ncbi:MAG: hypothetical protein WC465_01705 [Patescibacteria group bacterium]